jgi:hypothetical protein
MDGSPRFKNHQKYVICYGLFMHDVSMDGRFVNKVVVGVNLSERTRCCLDQVRSSSVA